jgi:glucosamine--fructose-6-phosphate aminotransferase (isomerizing)
MLAVYLGRKRGTLSADRGRTILDALWHVPARMRDLLADGENIKHVAKRHRHARDMLFLGRGTNFPIALEGALKLKEISYIHAEGYAAGEMKHGPIALIDEEMPVVVVCPRDAHYEKTLSNMQEVKAREGQLIGICTRGDTDVHRLCMPDGAVHSSRSSSPPEAPAVFEIPEVAPEVLPLLTVLPLQLLAYYMADIKGTDVDQPRNLAKTVTVE